MKKIEELLQKAGSDESHSSVNMAEIFFSDEQKMRISYEFYVEELHKIEKWNEASNLSEFELFSENGRPSTTNRIAEDLFIRISVKGSGKFDWVRVTRILKGSDETVLTVKPTFDPTAKEVERDKISHFFTDAAENNFCLVPDGQKIRFYVIGLNEYENDEQTHSLIETIRNWITANFGSYLGMQKVQWSTFAENFLKLIKD